MATLTTFTTWAALYAEMLNAAARFFSGQMGAAEYEINTGGSARKLKYRTVDEFKDGLEFVKNMAELEAAGGTAIKPVVRRTYAKNGGGGRW